MDDFFSALRIFVQPPKRGTPLRVAGVIAGITAVGFIIVQMAGFGQDAAMVLRAALSNPLWLAMALLTFAAWSFFASARQEEAAIAEGETRLAVIRDAVANIGRIASLETALPQCERIRLYALSCYSEAVEALRNPDRSGNYDNIKHGKLSNLDAALDNTILQIGALRADASGLEPRYDGPAFEDFKPEHMEHFPSALERDRWKRLVWRATHIPSGAETMIHELHAELRQRRQQLISRP